MLDKRYELLRLAKLRQSTRWFGYKSIGDYHGGAYECDFVSPYTKTAGNIDAEILIMLQDWTSDDSMSCHRVGEECKFDEDSATLGYSEHWPTTKNLIRLLKQTFKLTLPEIYATNLFPFVKLGKPSAKIPRKDLLRAASEFGLPQIRIVNPKLVICLGKETFDALREASNLDQSPTLDFAIENPFDLPETETRIWCQAHTGYWGPINRNKVGRVSEDWDKMRADLLKRFGKVSPAKARTRNALARYSTGAKTVIAAPNAIMGELKPLLAHKLLTRKLDITKRETQRPCRVLAVSKSGEIIFKTPDRRSRPDLHKRIISNQRRELQAKYPSLKKMADVLYRLEWLEDGKWVPDQT